MFTLLHFPLSIRTKMRFLDSLEGRKPAKNTRSEEVKIFSGFFTAKKIYFLSRNCQKMFTDLHF